MHRRETGRLTLLQHWFLSNTLIAGVCALAWLVLRSGGKPSRLAYPCQQAAFSAASLAFGAPLVAAVLAVRRRVVAGLLSPRVLAVATLGLLTTAGLYVFFSRADAYSGPTPDPPADYRARVFHQTDCPQDPVGDHFPGLDDLIEQMGGHGLKFYRSPTASLIAGSEGILASNDVVLVKINYQWPQRGGTNTDLLRGLIRRIVDHPDGFTGEVVICENAQFEITENFDREMNNAQDHAQSPYDVVASFQARGYRVSLYDWTTIRLTGVDEYSQGDMTDGYIIYPLNQEVYSRESYPKFQTEYGTHISLKHGTWHPRHGYDRARLKLINMPVLKSHGLYGATAAVKNYMGVVTGAQDTSSHAGIHYGLLGAVIGEIQPADLNLVDAIWINGRPNNGPTCTYEEATRRDMLLASLDPVAVDIWSVKHILIPTFIENGYSYWPKADPDEPSSDFRQYLDNSMYQILDADYTVTNDLDQIDAIDLAPPGEASDPAGGGAPFTLIKQPGYFTVVWSDPVRGGPFEEFLLYRTDLIGSPFRVDPECETYLGTGYSANLSGLPDNHGFLVVARNSVSDGSFGHDSRGNERPDGSPDPI